MRSATARGGAMSSQFSRGAFQGEIKTITGERLRERGWTETEPGPTTRAGYSRGNERLSCAALEFSFETITSLAGTTR